VDDPALGAHNLWVAASAAGAVSRFRSTVTSIDRDGDRVAGVTVASGDRLAAEVVVNAAGPHSAAINTLAGVLDDFAISTRPLRQEVHQVGGPPELDGEVGVTVGDGDLGGYYRFTPGGGVLVGSQEPDCDDLEWLEDPDANNINPTVAGFERQTLRLARRMPSITIPNRPTGLAAAYDVSDDWIPIYDRTSLPGYFVAIGTSGNQFKNAPVIGSLVTAIVADSLRGGDHDAHPVTWHAPRIGVDVGLGHYSRLRSPNAASSNSVLG
jgi:sarcosine oxidase subunit beta